MEPTSRIAVVIEDDADIRELLRTVLTQSGFEVHTAGSGGEGVALVEKVDPIVITLDVSLPDFDGFEVARRVRGFSDAYIVMLTAFSDEIDTLMGLETADDYVTKPFRPRELRARIEAMLRRPRLPRPSPAAQPVATNGPAASQPTAPQATAQATTPAPRPEPDPRPTSPSVAPAPTDPASPAATPVATTPAPADPAADPGWDGLVVDVDARIVTVDGVEVALTKSEFDILAELVARPGRVVSKSDLVRALWGDSYDVGTLIGPADHRSIEVHVANLRRKIGDNAAESRWIDTVRGIGYRFRPRRSAAQ